MPPVGYAPYIVAGRIEFESIDNHHHPALQIYSVLQVAFKK